IIIPERDNIEELSPCLAAAKAASTNCIEPVQIVVVVNGSTQSVYDSLRREYSDVHWIFHDRPLPFTAAVSVGLTASRYEWLYLLNNDVVIEPEALTRVAALRRADIFSIASQIFFKDARRFRDETNWTTLFVDHGLAT